MKTTREKTNKQIEECIGARMTMTWDLYDKFDFLLNEPSQDNTENDKLYERTNEMHNSKEPRIEFVDCDNDIVESNIAIVKNKKRNAKQIEHTLFGNYVGKCLSNLNDRYANNAIQDINAILFKYKSSTISL